MSRFAVCALALLALSIASARAALLVPASSPSIEYMGRVARAGSGVSFDWPCVTVRMTFTGSASLQVRMNGGYNSFLVTEGANPGRRIETTSEMGVWTLLEGLSPQQTYSVEVMKITEASYFIARPLLLLNPVEIAAFQLDDGATVLPRVAGDSKRRIEFFGDSDTNGFGSNGPYSKTTCILHFRAYENCATSYAAVLARSLGAEFHMEAWSGKGVVKNAAGLFPSSDDTMPLYWNRTIAVTDAPLWDFASTSFVPDLVLVYLGSNDFFNAPTPSDDVFTAAYLSVLRRVIASYPQQPPVVLSVCGGLGTAAKPCPMVQAATQALAASEYPRAHYVEIPPTLLTSPDDYGCLNHRNIVGHAKVASFLEPVVRGIMGWSD